MCKKGAFGFLYKQPQDDDEATKQQVISITIKIPPQPLCFSGYDGLCRCSRPRLDAVVLGSAVLIDMLLNTKYVK